MTGETVHQGSRRIRSGGGLTGAYVNASNAWRERRERRRSSVIVPNDEQSIRRHNNRRGLKIAAAAGVALLAAVVLKDQGMDIVPSGEHWWPDALGDGDGVDTLPMNGPQPWHGDGFFGTVLDDDPGRLEWLEANWQEVDDVVQLNALGDGPDLNTTPEYQEEGPYAGIDSGVAGDSILDGDNIPELEEGRQDRGGIGIDDDPTEGGTGDEAAAGDQDKNGFERAGDANGLFGDTDGAETGGVNGAGEDAELMDGFVEHGDGYTDLYHDMTHELGVADQVSGSELYGIYEGAVERFGADHIDLLDHAGPDIYTYEGEARLSATGEYRWESPEVAEWLTKAIMEQAEVVRDSAAD